MNYKLELAHVKTVEDVSALKRLGQGRRMYFENKKLLARKLPVKPTVFCLYEGPLDTLNFW